MISLNKEQLVKMIDHTELSAHSGEKKISNLCSEARSFGFFSVCVNSAFTRFAKEKLEGSSVVVCTVAGFPLGACTTETKVFESRQAVESGAGEIDMVINVGALRGGDYERVRADIAAVVKACHAGGAIVKAILENSLLDDSQKAIACALAKSTGADFVKTSTGFAASGATAEDVALMRRVVGPKMGVKAAGGIRTLEDLRRMVAAGACRVGASASVAIIEATAAGG